MQVTKHHAGDAGTIGTKRASLRTLCNAPLQLSLATDSTSMVGAALAHYPQFSLITEPDMTFFPKDTRGDRTKSGLEGYYYFTRWKGRVVRHKDDDSDRPIRPRSPRYNRELAKNSGIDKRRRARRLSPNWSYTRKA